MAEEAHTAETVYRKKQKQKPKYDSSHSTWHVAVWSSVFSNPATTQS